MRPQQTRVSIKGDAWLINGRPTYEGRKYRGWKIEGLLLLSRMVLATFDDENEFTRILWNYPDTGRWDPDRNTAEFVAAMPEYKAHGLLAVAINLQGGSPLAYYRDREVVKKRLRSLGVEASDDEIWAGLLEKSQPWHNSAFDADGRLKQHYLNRLKLILDKADELGMVVVLGLFYFGQDERLRDEQSIRRAVDEICGWVLDQGYTNVVIEINNECNVPRYEHEILQPHRVHELIEQVKGITHNGRRLLVGTSYASMGPDPGLPDDSVIAASDFVLLHGNGVHDPNRLAQWVEETRALKSYRPMPILFNEDDHYDFDKPLNNFTAALSAYASWGCFDNGGETDPSSHSRPAFGNYKDGYQNLPVNWGISSPRKRAFFDLVREVAGS